jgi:hypothetical protein
MPVSHLGIEKLKVHPPSLASNSIPVHLPLPKEITTVSWEAERMRTPSFARGYWGREL